MNWTDCWEKKHTHTAAGYGIFARQDIHRGQPIFCACPELGVNPMLITNHSCIPNMFTIGGRDPYMGYQEFWFYAIREIKMGEELTVCYSKDIILREDSIVERREWIRSIWGFECVCLKCVGEWPGVDWKCPEHWIINYNMSNRDLARYLNGLVRIWKVENERVRFQKRDKARILAQRTIFSLRSFGDDLKRAAEEIKQNTSDSRYRLKLESKILRSYLRRQRLIEDPALNELLSIG